MKITKSVLANETFPDGIKASMEFSGLYEDIKDPRERLEKLVSKYGAQAIVEIFEDAAVIRLRAAMVRCLVVQENGATVPSGISDDELTEKFADYKFTVGRTKINVLDRTTSMLDKLTNEQIIELQERLNSRLGV